MNEMSIIHLAGQLLNPKGATKANARRIAAMHEAGLKPGLVMHNSTLNIALTGKGYFHAIAF